MVLWFSFVASLMESRYGTTHAIRSKLELEWLFFASLVKKLEGLGLQLKLIATCRYVAKLVSAWVLLCSLSYSHTRLSFLTLLMCTKWCKFFMLAIHVNGLWAWRIHVNAVNWVDTLHASCAYISQDMIWLCCVCATTSWMCCSTL